MNGAVFGDHFARAMLSIRAEHALPAEKIQKKEIGQSLLDVLKNADDRVRKARLRRLTIDEQQSIYSLYTLTQEAELRKRIDQLVVQYASWSLFVSGWTVFQLHFPNQAVQRSLDWLWRYLNHTKAVKQLKPPYLINVLTEAVSLGVTSAEFLQASLAVMKEDIRSRNDQAALQEFINRRQIQAGSRFAAKLFNLWTTGQEDNELTRRLPFLSESWTYLPPKDLAALMSRILNSNSLKETDRSGLLYALNDAISRQGNDTSFLQSSLPKSIGNALTAADREAWTAWQILDGIKHQYATMPAKRNFMLQIRRQIQDVSWLDSTTVAWRFYNFYLVDSLLSEEHSYLYSMDSFHAIRANVSALGDPVAAGLTVQVILDPRDAARRQGILQIAFIEPELSKALQTIKIKLNGSFR